MTIIWNTIKRRKKWIAALLAAAALAWGGAAYFRQAGAPAAAVNTATAERGDIQATIAATGTISAVNSVEISSRVTGLITEVKVKENDIVKTGQVLVVLDDTAIRAQLSQYQAQLQNYAAVYERSQKLAAIGGESQQQLDSDRTNYLVAQSTYDNYASQLAYYVIKAPIDGVVIGTPTPAGQTVAQGISSPQVIMTIADMSKMQIKVLVDESDIGRVKVGQPVSFTVDAYPSTTFTGKVTSISRSATTSSNVIYYPVYVDVDSTESLLYPTMTARVTVTVGESKDALVVPLAAVKEAKGQKYVQLAVGDAQQNTPVETGLSDEERVEILSGLREGDAVVIPAAKPKTAATNQNQGPPPPI